jgi:hypothetical protein
MWSEGDEFLVRYESLDGAIRGARPTRVVGERNGYLATWLAAGTTVATPRLADGRDVRAAPPHERYAGPRSSHVGPWRGEGILMLFPDAAAHSIWLFWKETGEFWGWYVNLERLHEWTARGVDTRDHALDIWTEEPRAFSWKDADELADAVEVGAFTQAQADEIWCEGKRVAGMIERWQSPFADGWERWRPDPAWPTPQLPDDWAR